MLALPVGIEGKRCMQMLETRKTYSVKHDNNTIRNTNSIHFEIIKNT